MGSAALAAVRPLEARRGPARLLVRGLTLLSIVCLFLISAQLLHAWGVAYDTAGGSPIVKIHPSTWAALAALALEALRHGDPLNYFARAARWRGLVLLFFAWLALALFITLEQRIPVTPIVDSFLLPMMLFLLFVEGGLRPGRRLALLLHLLLTANAAIAIVEFFTGWRLTPFWAGDLLQVGDWRSTALLGHPLANASITGVYALALALGGGRDLPVWTRPLGLSLQLAALVAFGGRTALILCFVLLGAIAAFRLARILAGAAVPLRAVALMCIGAPVLLWAVALAFQAGVFDRLIYRFVDDYGSAQARVVMFRVFDMFPARQILFGPDQDWLTSLQNQEGISYGIESFWVSFVLEHGLLMSIPFFFGLAAFSVDLLRATRRQTLVLLIFFYVVASASVSLTAKSSGLGLFVIVVMTLFRPMTSPGRQAREASRAALGSC